MTNFNGPCPDCGEDLYSTQAGVYCYGCGYETFNGKVKHRNGVPNGYATLAIMELRDKLVALRNEIQSARNGGLDYAPTMREIEQSLTVSISKLEAKLYVEAGAE